jgi:hypothetical protein
VEKRRTSFGGLKSLERGGNLQGWNDKAIGRGGRKEVEEKRRIHKLGVLTFSQAVYHSSSSFVSVYLKKYTMSVVRARASSI